MNPALDDMLPESKLNPEAVVTNSTSGRFPTIVSTFFATISVRCKEAASGSWIFTNKYPISSEGINPPGKSIPTTPVPTNNNKIKTIPRFILPVITLVKEVYFSVDLSNILLNPAKNFPRIPP